MRTTIEEIVGENEKTVVNWTFSGTHDYELRAHVPNFPRGARFPDLIERAEWHLSDRINGNQGSILSRQIQYFGTLIREILWAFKSARSPMMRALARNARESSDSAMTV